VCHLKQYNRTLLLDALYEFNYDCEWILKECKFIITINFCERLVVAIFKKFKISLYSQIIKCDELWNDKEWDLLSNIFWS
jgi:hypothetical protein